MLAIRYGASALGLVSEMPSGPGVIDDNSIAQITSRIPPPIATFLLTSKQNANEIISQHAKTRTNTLQLAMELKKGDRVLFAKYAGSEIKIDGVEHIFMREDDIPGVLE